MEYIIYTDESEGRGKYYSNFYGGALVRSTDLAMVERSLSERKIALNLLGEVKWSKISALDELPYGKLLDTFFDHVLADRIKVRVMFTQNANVALNLTADQRKNEYFLLYYQFFKHAFGLQYSNSGEALHLRLLLDKVPDNREQIAKFRGYLCGLSRSVEFRHAKIRLENQQIAEVDSRQHVVLQCLDVVLGAIQFKLNDKHKEKAPGTTRRGRKTRAKENLYRHIYKHLCKLRPNFNAGISTGIDGDPRNVWQHPYRHWLFVPRNHKFDGNKTKRK